MPLLGNAPSPTSEAAATSLVGEGGAAGTSMTTTTTASSMASPLPPQGDTVPVSTVTKTVVVGPHAEKEAAEAAKDESEAQNESCSCNCIGANMNWYAQVLCHHPYAVLGSVVIIVGTMLVLSLTARPLPAFNDPAMGFEARGTTISQRARAWENLLEATRPSGPLSFNPADDPLFLGNKTTTHKKAKPKHRHKICVQMTDHGPVEVMNCSDVNNYNSSDYNDFNDIPKTGIDLVAAMNNKDRVEDDGYNIEDDWDFSIPENAHGAHNHSHFGADGFFCGPVLPDYSHVIVKSQIDRESLLTTRHLKAICELDTRIRGPSEFQNVCTESSSGKCCPSWSLPNYVALITNRSSCHDITDSDVRRVSRLLHRCSNHFDMELEGGCGPLGCRRVPEACLKNDAVYTILHYLVDASYLMPQAANAKFSEPSMANPHKQQNKQLEQRLTVAAIFLPIPRSTAVLAYYEQLDKVPLVYDNVTVVAMDLGLKHVLFDKLLLADSWLVGVGAGVVLLLMWAYTGSLFITLVTNTTVACALIIAYFMYIFIYEITFFPYMNVLTAIIAIGIGADDSFVYCRVWSLAKQNKESTSLVKLVGDALHHASASIIVTSLTTSAAFFASCVSHITAIRCFSIFAGTVVLANLVLMLTWVPACVVVAERWGAASCCLCVPPTPAYASDIPPKCSSVCALPLRFCYWTAESGRVYFEKILPWVVIKLRYLWIILLGICALISAVIVFYKPRLRLPDSQEFQLFNPQHYFEQYDLKYKYQFWFERNLRNDIVNHLPLRIVWGINPVDNGNYLDPESIGHLEFDETFDVSPPESQEWLLNFCRNLRNQTFYQSTLGPLLPNCFIETFKSWMERKCVDPIDRLSRFPCCEDSKFPYSHDVFDKCIHEGIQALYQTPREYFIPGVAGPKFNRFTGKLSAVVVEYDSNVVWSLSYDEMHYFFTEVEKWVSKQMSNSPPGMQNGWFTSYLEFYDVQHSLSVGTGVAVGVAVGCCLAVLILTTLNLVVSLLAILSVGSVMLVSLAILVLLGWRLNVLESVTVSVAIGLAIDFTLHYGVAYRLAPEPEREAAVTWAVSRLGSPVFMAALTSLAAGIAMLPANVLAYIHIGTFLVVITATSYIYATLFYLPLLRIFGPEGGFGQLSYPKLNCCTCCRPTQPKHVGKTVYQQQAFMSESTLSTSSTSGPHAHANASSDHHELEPLTAMRLSGRSHGRNHGSQRQKVGRVDPQDSTENYSPNGGRNVNQMVGRSGSMTSNRGVEGGAFVPRKKSLPSPGGATSDGGEPSPRHTVAPASSATTILYSEPDTDHPHGHHPPLDSRLSGESSGYYPAPRRMSGEHPAETHHEGGHIQKHQHSPAETHHEGGHIQKHQHSIKSNSSRRMTSDSRQNSTESKHHSRQHSTDSNHHHHHSRSPHDVRPNMADMRQHSIDSSQHHYHNRQNSTDSHHHIQRKSSHHSPRSKRQDQYQHVQLDGRLSVENNSVLRRVGSERHHSPSRSSQHQRRRRHSQVESEINLASLAPTTEGVPSS